MKATELNRIAAKAKADGYDQTVKTIYRKILEAAKVGEFDVNIAILPWWNFEHKHVEFFVNRDFKVDVDKDHINISWKMEF